ncbi:S41 family peptidase [Marinoscillum furvescens]|uniref:Peptidase S41-like protein n=1 Tax=Marinoscillum furvescens DSM 4134 TaxID=1122208 RepID=A0A3D9L5E5_MARFU|nr:S41 family peptidase [Marinoscillum furvescens]RED99849.1 peptidase S41-like protein [Marinoscillum furvescens DSM 4134]
MRKLVILLTLSTLVLACKKDDEPRSEFDVINDWIYSEMNYWYFWESDLPAKPSTNQSPRDFFYQLLSVEDRFSFIYEDYQELIDLLNGVSLESGFEYKIYRDANTTDGIFLQLSYIKKGSPAEELGLKRGDRITAINGNPLNTSNYRSLLGDTNAPYEAAIARHNTSTDEFDALGNVQITPITFAENPILLDTIYEIEGKKIAYLIYTFFSPGATEKDGSYDAQLRDVFDGFKANGAQDLILDLRFNSGGSETSVKTLSSLITPGISEGDLLFKKQYNRQVEEYIVNDDDLGPEFLNVRFQELTQNIGNELSTATVYFITSDRSASASEVVINSVKPYMSTFIVGDTTVGKDAGSITIYEDDNPLNSWAIQPIIVKLVNADGEDYPFGLTPNVPLEERFAVLRPLGDTEEPLLANALAAIGVQSSRISVPPHAAELSTVGSSLDKKPWAGKLLLERFEE